MKRYNLIQARGGEFTSGTEGIAMEGEGNDVVEFKIKRGTLKVIVPASLKDSEVLEEWFNHHTALDIELEDDMRITGWIRGGDAHLETALPVRRRKSTRKPARGSAKHSLVKHRLLTKRTANE